MSVDPLRYGDWDEEDKPNDDADESNVGKSIKDLVEKQDTDNLMNELQEVSLSKKLFIIGTGNYLITYGEVTLDQGRKPCLILRKYPEDGSELEEQSPLTEDDCGVGFVGREEIESAIARVKEAYPQFEIQMNNQVFILSRNRQGLDVLEETLVDMLNYADENIWGSQ